MSWYTNPWVVGVVGGIPSGLLVNWVSRYALSKREDREYLQKTIGANREIIYAVRPGISEGHIPTYEVLTALINATARRYNVESRDLYGAKQISEELMKEVMDSSFISSSQKAEYCNRLAELGKVAAYSKDDQSPKTSQPTELLLYRRRIVETTSKYLGFLTAVLAVTLSLLELSRSKLLTSVPNAARDKVGYLLPGLLAPAIIAASTAAYSLYRELARRREQHNEVERAKRLAEIAESRAKESLLSLQRSLSDQLTRSTKQRTESKSTRNS